MRLSHRLIMKGKWGWEHTFLRTFFFSFLFFGSEIWPLLVCLFAHCSVSCKRNNLGSCIITMKKITDMTEDVGQKQDYIIVKNSFSKRNKKDLAYSYVRDMNEYRSS